MVTPDRDIGVGRDKRGKAVKLPIPGCQRQASASGSVNWTPILICNKTQRERSIQRVVCASPTRKRQVRIIGGLGRRNPSQREIVALTERPGIRKSLSIETESCIQSKIDITHENSGDCGHRVE